MAKMTDRTTFIRRLNAVKEAIDEAKLRTEDGFTYRLKDLPGDEAQIDALIGEAAIDAIAAYEAALAEEGYVVVPRTPDRSMVIAGNGKLDYAPRIAIEHIWQAMLAAAPSPKDTDTEDAA